MVSKNRTFRSDYVMAHYARELTSLLQILLHSRKCLNATNLTIITRTQLVRYMKQENTKTHSEATSTRWNIGHGYTSLCSVLYTTPTEKLIRRKFIGSSRLREPQLFLQYFHYTSYEYTYLNTQRLACRTIRQQQNMNKSMKVKRKKL
jgi:hypothetical protein